ncbi:MAG: NifB/NifX family molybdenum-iron cluster-binding protein [Deltaproteobacteria bacterium]|nr:NifB/NifX family molybdenum-iron cluster-binding protein [Deltaproteobacteria bacterium]
MKIAISVTKAGTDATLEMRFGRCPYFAVYDSDSKTYEWFENSGIKAASGAGTGAAQALLDRNIEVVISGQYGPKAAQVLGAGNIKMLLGPPELPVAEVIAKWQANELKEYAIQRF